MPREALADIRKTVKNYTARVVRNRILLTTRTCQNDYSRSLAQYGFCLVNQDPDYKCNVLTYRNCVVKVVWFLFLNLQ